MKKTSFSKISLKVLNIFFCVVFAPFRRLMKTYFGKVLEKKIGNFSNKKISQLFFGKNGCEKNILFENISKTTHYFYGFISGITPPPNPTSTHQDSHSAVKHNNADFKARIEVVFLKKVQFSIDHLCLKITTTWFGVGGGNGLGVDESLFFGKK